MSGLPENPYQLTEMVDRFIASRHINQQQYQDLTRLVLADGSIDEQERQQINRLFDAIRNGRIQVVD
ncbi:MAG: hypothetical protein ACFBSG_07985 [Leptolyngbyaceae cyanobacterium]